MQITLTTSINGKPVNQADKKRITYESAVVSQVIADVNKRMTNFSIKDNSVN